MYISWKSRMRAQIDRIMPYAAVTVTCAQCACDTQSCIQVGSIAHHYYNVYVLSVLQNVRRASIYACAEASTSPLALDIWHHVF